MQSTNRPVNEQIIKSLPKVELHRHLEGSFRLETLLEFAKKRNLSHLPLDDKKAFRQFVQMTSDDTPDFLTFLSKFRAEWYSTIDDPRRLAYESVVDAAKENIMYYEMRFSPEHFRRESNFSIEAVIEAVIEGAKTAGAEHDIEVAFLITMGRDKLPADEMIKYIKTCEKYRDQGIVGIDLAGDEIHYPPELFKKTFKGLYEKTGFYATIHAGEAVGPENVKTSILDLDAARIGHGIRTIEDPAVVDLVREKGILLEQCLTSNLLTGTIPKIEKHPFPLYYKQGVKVTLNSDDPQIQQSDLNDDYWLATKHFQFTMEDFKQINLTSLNGSFQPQAKKEALIKKYLEQFQS